MGDIDRRKYTHIPYTGSCELFTPDKRIEGGEWRPKDVRVYYHESAVRELVGLLKEFEMDPLGLKVGLCDRVEAAFTHYKDLLP